MASHLPNWFALGLLLLLGITPAKADVADVNTLVAFSGSIGSGPNGAKPYSGLLIGSDGNFYGTTHQGGTNGLPFGNGTAFKLAPSGSITTLVSFNNTNGAQPYAALASGLDGNLYGTTLLGGTSNLGTVFRLSTNGNLTSLLSFTNANGAKPSAQLTLAVDGFFYGTTQLGGTSNLGTVFRVTTNGVLNTLISLSGTNGSRPYAEVIQGMDGHLYGTTLTGGILNQGTIFRLTTNGIHTVLFSFAQTNGAAPFGGLVQDPSGVLYGTTKSGGDNDAGTIFRITTNGNFTLLRSFSGADDGANPQATLLRGRDGTYYGSTILGGNAADIPRGTVFQFTTNSAFTVLASFGFDANGASPYGKLVQDGAGYLYGTTFDQGAGLKGTVFRLGPNRAVLETLATAGGGVQVKWEAWLGQMYQVQIRTNLNQIGWSDFTSLFPATNGTMTITDSVSGSYRFYRVREFFNP